MEHEGPITVLIEDLYMSKPGANRRFGLHHPECKHLDMATAKAEKHCDDAFHYECSNPKDVLTALQDHAEAVAFECDQETLIKWKHRMEAHVGVQDGWKTMVEEFIDLDVKLPPCLHHTVHRAIEAEFTHEFIQKMCHNWKWLEDDN